MIKIEILHELRKTNQSHRAWVKSITTLIENCTYSIVSLNLNSTKVLCNIKYKMGFKTNLLLQIIFLILKFLNLINRTNWLFQFSPQKSCTVLITFITTARVSSRFTKHFMFRKDLRLLTNFV